MIKTLSLTLLALFMGACSYVNEPLKLQPYEANYAAPVSKEKKSIYVRSVNDLRADKQNIGYAVEGGKRTRTFFTYENFSKKYADALKYALNISEFNTNVTPREASAIIDVNIKNISLVYLDKSFDENVKGEMAVELVLTQGSRTTKYNFTQKGGKWLKPSRNSTDLEPFLSELFSESIEAVVTKLVQ